MSDIDALIQDLYPETKKNGGGGTPATPSTGKHSFDDDDEAKATSTSKKKKPVSNSFDDSDSGEETTAKPSGTKKNGGGNSFDDSDDDDSHHPVGRKVKGSAVQFPTLPETPLVQTCNRRCVLTSSATAERPCPFIRCIQCDYLVVRCPQPAEWLDQDGQKDLYLTMRYFYPDWRAFDPKVLRMGPNVGNSAAYCCQCTWFTVSDEKSFEIATALGVQKFNKPGDGHEKGPPAFTTSTKQLKAEGGKKPLPRWLCSGHFPL